MKRVKRTLKPEIGSYSNLLFACLCLRCYPLPPLLLHLHTELCLFPLFSSSSSSSAASTYVDLLLFDIMAKYCIANIFVLLGLACLASGLAWPALLWVCLCPPLSLPPCLFVVSVSPLTCSISCFFCFSFALLCFAASASRKVAKLT